MKPSIRFIGLVALVLTPCFSFAQKDQDQLFKALDSLNQMINTNQTAAENLSMELLEQARNINDETAVARSLYLMALTKDHLGKLSEADSIYKEARRYYKTMDDETEVARITYRLSIVESKRSNFALSDALAEEAIGYFLAQEDYYSVSKAYSIRGINFNVLQKFDSSIIYFDKTIHYAELAGRKEMIWRAKYNMIHILRAEDKFYETLESAFEMMAIADSLPDPYFRVQSNFVLGVSYTFVRDFEKSEEYLKKSLQLYNEYNFDDPNFLALIYTNLGTIGSEGKQIEYLEKALEVYNQTENDYEKVMVLNRLSEKWVFDDPEKTVALADQSIEISKRFGEDYVNVSAISNKVYGLVSLNRYKEALRYAVILEARMDELDFTDIYRLYLAYKGDGQVNKAFEMLEKHNEVKKTFEEQDFIRSAAVAEAKFQYEQDSKINEIEKEQTRLTFESELQRQQFIQYVAIGAFLIFLTISFLLFKFYKVKKRDNRLLALKNDEINHKSETLKTTNEKLIALDRFKEAMTGMIAHDLKNPLSAILRRVEGDNITHEMAKQMLQLVNNLLDVQKFEKTEVRLNSDRMKLSELINDARAQVVWLLSEKNIALKLSNIENWMVFGDREILTRVFVNLLTNGIKYSDVNSTIEIRGGLEEGKVKISVVDQGYGIPKEEAAKIFDSFTQIDPKTSGGVASTGLGLTFCKLALKAHGSSIRVESEVGEGSTFSFLLEKYDETENSQLDNPRHEFTMTNEERDIILKKLPELRALKLYQAFEIEEVLGSIPKESSQSVNDWVESVLNAAYTGNQKHYEELLEDLEQPKA